VVQGWVHFYLQLLYYLAESMLLSHNYHIHLFFTVSELKSVLWYKYSHSCSFLGFVCIECLL
jgi:hypothetical protein